MNSKLLLCFFIMMVASILHFVNSRVSLGSPGGPPQTCRCKGSPGPKGVPGPPGPLGPKGRKGKKGSVGK